MLQATSIEGIYESCIGIREPIPMIQYWEQFGYRIGQVGELPIEAVNKLYGVYSSLYSIRLYHQDADHGLIRLMVWEKPTNDGLKMASMKVKGNRWVTIFCPTTGRLIRELCSRPVRLHIWEW